MRVDYIALRATLSGGRAVVPLGKPAVRGYPLTATYFGTATTAPSAGTGTLTIARRGSPATFA